MKTIVAYYSLTGNTEKIARAIAEALSADLEPIRDVRQRVGGGGSIRAGFEAFLKLTPAIRPWSKDLPEYDLVILGCPVWGQNMASPMRAFIKRERRKIKQAALFCTQEGTGGERVLRQMAALAGCASIGDLIVSAKDIRSGQFHAQPRKFAEQLLERRHEFEVKPRAA